MSESADVIQECLKTFLTVYEIHLTLLEIVGFPDVDADESHQLQLRQPLSSGRRQRQQIP